MARLVTSGAEFQAATTVVNQAEGQGYTCLGTIETTVVRSGGAAWKASANGQYSRWAQTTDNGRNYFVRGYFRFPSAPVVQQVLIAAVPSNLGTVRTLAGTTQVGLFDNNDAQIGSWSAALPTGDFENRIEMEVGITSQRLFLYVNGVLIASSSSAVVGSSAITEFRFGNSSASASTDVVYWDDVAINDSTGGADDGLPGPGKIILRLAASDFQRDTNWLNAAGGTTSLFAEVDQTPPTAVPATPVNLISNSASTTTETYTAETTTYSAGGITAADRIKVVQAVATIGDSVAAATRSVGLKLDANPSDTEVTATTPNGAAGTYPLNWITMRGTLDSSPSVTLGDPIRVRVRKNSANADPLFVALLGVYVEYAEQLVDSEADSVSATDAQTAEAGLVKADSVTATDASATEAGPTKADSVSASEQVSVEPGLVRADSVSATDAAVSDVTTQQADTATLSDAHSLEAGPGVADSVTATDALVAEGQAVTSDTATVTDAVAVEVEATQADSVTASDFLGAELFTEQVAADSVTATDAQALEVEVAVDDSVTVADSVVSVPPPGVTDTGGGWAMPPKLPLRLAHELNLVDLVVASDHLEAEFEPGSLDHRLPLTDTVVVDDRWKLELELDADFQLEEELILALL